MTRIAGTQKVVNHLRSQVLRFLVQRDIHMAEAREAADPAERRFRVRLARMTNLAAVKTKRRINRMQGRRPTDDGRPQPPARPQLELRMGE